MPKQSENKVSRRSFLPIHSKSKVLLIIVCVSPSRLFSCSWQFARFKLRSQYLFGDFLFGVLLTSQIRSDESRNRLNRVSYLYFSFGEAACSLEINRRDETKVITQTMWLHRLPFREKKEVCVQGPPSSKTNCGRLFLF